MKRTVVLSMLAMLFVLPLSAQDITNTLGPGGKFTIKDLTKTFFTLRQSTGNVGIGTISPISRLHIVSGAASVPPRLQSSGTTGFAAGWDFYQGSVGKGYVGVPDLGASFGSGELLLFGGVGTKVSLWANQARAVTIATNGNVGIGTVTPASKLEVRGDIRLGSSGQYRATGGEENLRIVRGTVSAAGNILRGSGFTVSRLETGRYNINFNTAFAGTPSVTGTADSDGGGQSLWSANFAMTEGTSASSAGIRVVSYDGSRRNQIFHFIAIGPR